MKLDNNDLPKMRFKALVLQIIPINQVHRCEVEQIARHGPNSLGRLREALEAQDLSFARPKDLPWKKF